MFENESALYRFVNDYLRNVAADVPEDQLLKEPGPGVKPPIWVLGHLAVSCDYALRTMGQPLVCPRAWHKMFGPGSPNIPTGDEIPTKQELLDTIQQGSEAVLAAVAGTEDDDMNQPHAVELLKGSAIKTKGQLIAHLMTTHASFHLSQLSTWRRAVGKPPIV